MASDVALPGAAVLSSVSTVSIHSSDALENLESPAKTLTSSKRRAGRKSTPKSLSDSLLDEDDLEHLRKPFSFGWKREVVHRNTPPGQSRTSSMCDIYYFSPNGKKLRSMVEIAAYVDSQEDSPVNLTHFTFKRMRIFSPPQEVVRTAGKTGKKVTGADNLAKTEISKDVRRKSKKIIEDANLSAESFCVPSSVDQLASASKDSQAASEDTAENTETSSEALTIPDVQLTQPVTFIRCRGRPRGSKVMSVRLSTKNILQRQGLMRARRRSPDWSPDSLISPKTPLKKRNVKVITKSLGNSHSSDDEDSELQNILGTPSKLIASIVRPEPPKRPLDAEVADQTSKKIKLVGNKTVQSFASMGSTPTLLDNSTQPQRVMITNPDFISSALSNWRICSRACPDMRGVVPAHKCIKCGLRYHRVCVQLHANSADVGLCINCGRNKTGPTIRFVSLPSGQQFKPQQSLLKMTPPSMTSQGLGSLTDPIVLSPCVVSASSTSSYRNKPLMTSSSLPQMLSPVFLISGQNSVTVPPPPPLASCPQFGTPMTLLPLHFTSEVPPPRLQLCNIPQISQPPPLLLAGSVVPPSSLTSSIVNQLPALLPRPPLLTSQSITFQPSLTMASNLRLMSRIDHPSTDFPSKSLSTSIFEVKLVDSTPRTSPITVGSEDSGSVSDTIVLTDDECTETSAGDTVLCGLPAYSQRSGCLNTVKDLLKQRIKGSMTHTDKTITTTNDDIDDYPPVTFDPVITESATYAQNGSVIRDMLRAPVPVNFHRELESHVARSTPSLQQDQPGTSHDESMEASDGDIIPVGLPADSQRSGRLNTVKDLLKQRVKDSMTHTDNTFTSASDDIDDYPLVTFDPVITKSSTYTQNGSVIRDMLQAPVSVNFHKELESSVENVTKSATFLHPDQLFSLPGTSQVVTDILNGPAVSSIQTQESAHLAAAQRVDSHKINNTEFTVQSPGIYNIHGTAQPLLQFNVFQNNSLMPLGQMCTASVQSFPETKPAEQPKLTRKDFFSSFKIVHTSFNIMMKIFGHLPFPDLLRASCVCKVWRQLGMQPCLWRTVHLEGVKIRNWEKAAWFFNKVCVKSLKLKCSDFQSSDSISSTIAWDNIKRSIPTLTHLEELFFDQVPASVLDTLTEKMPHLVNIGAESIIDSSRFSAASVIPMLPMARTVERMSQAIEAITYGRLTTTNAAKLFQVSEKDLIHLTQTTDKLTGDEEAAVLLCCLRLSSMGFSVQKDTVMSKCQEMIARRYSTDSPVPMSDSYCRDLYCRNLPLFMPEVEKRSDTLRERFDTYYSALRKFYSNLWPKTTLSADQVLAFDLKPFNLGKDQRLNPLSSVAITVLSFMSGCTRFLPVMAVWPKSVAASHPDLMNVTSKRGIPTYLHIFQYFQKILSLVKQRPLVILCNGNATLLSEKLISSCLSDSVYLHCVPTDIAQYVFPGLHGGVLHVLKSQLSDGRLTCEDVASKLLNLLNFTKKTISRSTKLAFIATGAFPLNARAPVQYQALDLTDLSNQSGSWRKLCDVPEQQCSQSSGDKVAKPGSAVVTSGVIERSSGDMTETNERLGQDTTDKIVKSDKTTPAKQSVTRSRKEERRRINYAQMFAKKVLSQAKTGHIGSSKSPSKAKTASLSPLRNADGGLNSEATGYTVSAGGQQSTPIRQVLDVNSVNSHPHFEISPVRSEVLPAKNDQELVDHRIETKAAESGVSSSVMVLHNQAHSQTGINTMSSSTTECGAHTNLDNKKQTSTGSCSNSDSHQISPSSGSIVGVKFDISAAGSRRVMGSTETTANLSEDCGYSESESSNKEDSGLAERIETDDVSTIKCNINGDSNRLGSLKLNVVSVSNRNDNKEDSIKRNRGTEGQAFKGHKEGVHIAEDNEPSINVSPVKENKQQRREGKILQARQKLLETAGNSDRKTSTTDSVSEIDIDEVADADTELETRRKEMSHISLIDHDYIKVVRTEGIPCGNKKEGILVLEAEIERPKPCEVPVDQFEDIEVPEVTVSDCVYGGKDVSHMAADEETSVCSQQYDNTLNSGRSSHDSSRSSSDHETSQDLCKNSSKGANETEDSNSSGSPGSHAVDDNNEDSNVSGDDDDDSNDGSSHTSGPDGEEAEDDDGEDDNDDSKCQMCMRSVPPHSKDKIINWVDCDGNCGRWFHVICVTRAQTKADAVHFVCPSCRCNR